MHQGEELPAFAAGDPLDDAKAGILSFTVAATAAVLHTSSTNSTSPPLDEDREVLAHAQQWAGQPDGNSGHQSTQTLPTRRYAPCVVY